MQLAKEYGGREHSWVKHRLLESYLETALSIIAVSGARSITYVECFAGPWGDETQSLKGTSIAISLEILQTVRQTMLDRGLSPIEFRAVYVEKDRKSFKRLEKHLVSHTPSGIASHAFEGDYFDRQDEILRVCGASFTFFFIDPKGWLDVSIRRLSKLLRRPHSEFLINFMYDFVNRAVGMEKLRGQVEEVLGPLSRSEINSLKALGATQRGEFLVRRYRELLKREMGGQSSFRPRSCHAEILNKDKARLHYHLVYLTRHPKGIVKFAQESEKADYLQSIVRIEKRRSGERQMSMFSAVEESQALAENEVNLQHVMRLLLSKLSTVPTFCDEEFLADILEDTGWFISQIEQGIRQLMVDGRVVNLDATKLRPKHPVHFDKRERLVLTG